MATTLTCSDCNYVNEGERVYCHNCGKKLDRSLLPVDETVTETPEKARKRVLKMTNPSVGIVRGLIRPLLNSLAWAAVIAAMIQSTRPPDNVPPLPKKGEITDVPPIAMALEQASASPTATRVGIPEPTINAYLQRNIGTKQKEGESTMVRFVRAFVTTGDGVLRITSEQSLFDFSLYASTIYKLAIESNKLQATNMGGSVGRLPVHPLIMTYADAVFGKLWTALNREHKILDGMQKIEVSKGAVTVVTKPAKGTPR